MFADLLSRAPKVLFPSASIAALLIGCSNGAAPSGPDACSNPAPVTLQTDGQFVSAFLFEGSSQALRGSLLYVDGYPAGRREDFLGIVSAACKAGWSTLYSQHRGMWDSEGSFGIRNSIEDIRTALQYLKDLPTRPIAIAGYSFGGYGALMVSTEDAAIDCTISIDAADLAVRGRQFADDEAYLNGFREFSVAFIGPGLPFPQLDTDALFDEHMALPESAELKHLAGELAAKRLLLLSSNLETHSAGRLRYYAPLLAGLNAAGAAALTTRTVDTDHDFTGKHGEVRDIVTGWLNSVCSKPDDRVSHQDR